MAMRQIAAFVSTTNLKWCVYGWDAFSVNRNVAVGRPKSESVKNGEKLALVAFLVLERPDRKLHSLKSFHRQNPAEGWATLFV